jgi:SAM-dependent methyltransferase
MKIQTHFLFIFLLFLSERVMGAEEGWRNMLRSFLPAYLHDPSFIELYSETLAAEGRRERVVIEEEASCDKPHLIFKCYGYGFPQLSTFDMLVLREIREKYDQLNEGHVSGTPKKRPLVIDAGAGYGDLTWKLIASGGNVLAVEKQPTVAQKMCARSVLAKPFLPKGEKLSKLLKPVQGDLTTLITSKYTSNGLYDVAILRNVLHYMTPAQIDRTLHNIKEMVAPEGKLFISVDTLSAVHALLGKTREGETDKVSAAFKANKRLGHEFPGFLNLNMRGTKLVSGRITDHITDVLSTIIGIRAADEDCTPGEHLLVSKTETEILFSDTIHLFDLQTLNHLLLTKGFQIEALFRYHTETGEIINLCDMPESFDELNQSYKAVAIAKNRPS